MSLKKIFTVVDDIPHITAVAINIPCFKELYLADTTPDKSEYSKQLGYIFHMVSFESPYYDAKNKEKTVSERFMGEKSYKPNKLVKACLEECIQRETSPEQRSLDAAIVLSDSTADLAYSMRQEGEEYTKLMKDIEKELKNKDNDLAVRIDLMQKKQLLEKATIDRAKVASDVLSKIKRNTEELLALRKLVASSIIELEQNNKDAIGHFIVDKFIETYN